MMSFLQILQQAQHSSASAIHKFLLEHPKSPEHIFIFVEGDDDASFYTNFLLQFRVRAEIHIYNCGGKAEVIQTFNKIGGRDVTPGKALYFVDKDLSDFLGEEMPTSPNIYVTDYYSVENYLVDTTMFRRIWDELFHVTNAQIDCEPIVQLFERDIDVFYGKMIDVMALIIVWRQAGTRVNLNQVNLDRLFSFNDELELIPEENCIDTLVQMCNVTAIQYTDEDLENLSQVLRDMEAKQYVRGKFDIWFLVKFVSKLEEYLSNMLGQGQRVSIRTRIHLKNAVEVLGPRTIIPPTLRDFLESHFALTET